MRMGNGACVNSNPQSLAAGHQHRVDAVNDAVGTDLFRAGDPRLAAGGVAHDEGVRPRARR